MNHDDPQVPDQGCGGKQRSSLGPDIYDWRP